MRQFILSILLLFVALDISAQKRAMTTDDYLDMIRVGSSMISPDGNSVIFGKTKLNWEKNKYETTYHYIPADSGESYQYIGEEGASSMQYSPDGNYISLKRTVDGNSQLFLLPTQGGEAIQLTKHENSVGSYEWSSDSKAIYFVADVPKSDKEKKKYKAGYDHFFMDEAPNGQTEGDWNHLWKFDLESKKETKLTRGENIIGDFEVSPNQEKILLTLRFENRRNQGNLSEIYMLPAGDTTAIRLTENKAPENNLTWLPDNEHFLYTAPDDKEWELRQDKLWRMNADSREYEVLSGEFNGEIRDFYLTNDGNTVLFNGIVRTNANLYSLKTENGEITQHSNVKGSINIIDFDKSREKVLFTKEDIVTAPDLYVAKVDEIDNPVRLTNLNPFIKDSLKLAEYEIVNWASSDGMEIEGIEYRPSDIKNNGKAPFLLHIHGGPAGVFMNSFSPRYHIWAGLGYVQLAPNVRGSTAYGDEFLRANMQDIGDGDFQDLMTGVDKMIDDKKIDPNKMAVRGWSYGGILGGTVITKTDRFKAASLGAMVSDWTSEYALGFNFDISLWYIGGTPWSNPEAYRERSPAMHAKDVKTPTLFLHGQGDRVDTPEQSQIFFTYLRDIGKVDTRYISFKREGHGFREPRNQRTRDIEEIKWIQKYTLGKDWEPWVRKSDTTSEKKDSEE
ncbi:S9 family peptidase [Gracilimonas sp.]|uniref:S9 family peptidase n=1 Tax=Gracilimonas sp. TaxID=1974203 RepID=UPI0032EDE49B